MKDGKGHYVEGAVRPIDHEHAEDNTRPGVGYPMERGEHEYRYSSTRGPGAKPNQTRDEACGLETENPGDRSKRFPL